MEIYWIKKISIAAMFLSSCSSYAPVNDLHFIYKKTESFKEHESYANILYIAQSGDAKKAIEKYLERYKENKEHQFELIRQIGKIILEKSSSSRNPEDSLRAIFAAGIINNAENLPILEKALNNPNPQIQIAGIHFLSNLQDDRADELILEALKSKYLPVRLEASLVLASKKRGVEQINSFMHKIEEDIQPLFPRFFVMIGDANATNIIYNLLASHKPEVCLETILSIIEFKRDDFLPQIRALSFQQDLKQQEACAAAFGALRDGNSIPRLIELAHSPSEYVSLAAWKSLYLFGNEKAYSYLKQQALNGNLFAIANLKNVEASVPLLLELLKSENMQIRINAAISLLRSQKKVPISNLLEILSKDKRDTVFYTQSSPGKSINIWKAISPVSIETKNNPFIFEASQYMKEEVLKQSINLPEKDFLSIAHNIFLSRQSNLIPCLISLLETLNTQNSLNLLKTQQQQLGFPLARDYCNLSLFRLQETGPYLQNLKKWLEKYNDAELIHFKSIAPFEFRFHKPSHYELHPEERSKLLVESCLALAENRDEECVEIILKTLAKSKPQNQCILAGILLRAIE